MTALAASLFAFAGIVSAWTIFASVRRHGSLALSLRARLDACPDTLVICWRTVERARTPALTAVRAARGGRTMRPALRTPGLEWPGAALAA